MAQEKAIAKPMSKLRDYAQLTKLTLAAMVVFSAVIGYLIAAPIITFIDVILIAAGGFMVTGAANGINQIIERDIDAKMNRTANRPLASGRMTIAEACLVCGILAVAGIATLSLAFNGTAGILGALSMMIYAFMYTPLKQHSAVAVFVGAIPGAMPPMIGYVAATGSIDFMATLLFSLQFLWQFPHFWAIAWLGFDDYKRGGIMLLPSKEGKNAFTGFQSAVYAFMLIPVGLLPYFLEMIGPISTTIIVLAGIHYFVMAINLMTKRNDKSARQLMFSSFLYLPVVMMAMWLGAKM